ncbi:MAG: ATP synthase F1 subunit gamma [Bdellovibrionaceae bacterium]|nr:ATP synthase F1 subunit gamma [Pseudobdellovibrionaceae bacterium]
MPSLKDIRSRIDSTKNTQAITRAMKLVSAAKLRRAQHQIVNLRPYAHTLLSVISDIAATHRIDHPLLVTTSEAPKKVLVAVLTSDRGLCGAFNTNINRFAERWYNQNKASYEKVDFIFIGRRAIDHFRKRGLDPIESVQSLAREVSYNLAVGIADKIMNAYASGEYDEVKLIYNEFKSAIQQNVVSETMLPVNIESSTLTKGEGGFPPDMIFEPAPEEMIDSLLKKHFAVQVYRAMSESVAAEHGARMTSMENATKNAGELIRSLTLTYNKLRQAAITTELIEITSGAEALKG